MSAPLTLAVLTRETLRLIVAENPGRIQGDYLAPVKRLGQLHVDLVVGEKDLELSLDEFSKHFLKPAAVNLVGCAKHYKRLLVAAPPAEPGIHQSRVESFSGVELRGTLGEPICGGERVLRFDVGTLRMPRY